LSSIIRLHDRETEQDAPVGFDLPILARKVSPCLLLPHGLWPGWSRTGVFAEAINPSAIEGEADSFLPFMKLSIMTQIRLGELAEI
jgi:hypothetical protein